MFQYRATHMVVEKFILISMWKFHFSIRSLYCEGIVNLVSTKTIPLPYPYGSPTLINLLVTD